MIKTCYLTLVVFLLSSSLSAQTTVADARLNGTVTDPTSAAIPDAKVTVHNTETGLTRETQTTDAGLYDFPSLPVGRYELTIEKTGFSSVKRTGILLTVGALTTIDTSLQLGGLTEVVEVTEVAPVVESSRSSTATTISMESVSNLPLNGRSFIDLSTLTPGVVRDPTRGGDFAFGGQRGPNNSVLVDGADSNNLFFGQATGRTGFRPPAFSQGAIQEFQINTNSYAAEIGRASGGVLNVITRSGTNELHGSAFDFYRDKGMNANTFVNNRNGARKTPYHFHQFGGTLGGPIRKDKLFFFVSYDGQRNKQSQVLTPQVPPPGGTSGPFAKSLSS